MRWFDDYSAIISVHSGEFPSVGETEEFVIIHLLDQTLGVFLYVACVRACVGEGCVGSNLSAALLYEHQED